MKLILLGTSGYHPTDQRQTACLMLPEVGVVLDAGTAMYRARRFLATDQLDIFLTHAHLDHVIGLTYLFDVLRDRNVRRVTVHATPETLQAIERHLFAEPLFPVKPPCDLRPLARETSLPQGGCLTHFPLTHPGGAIGFRLDWPQRSMAYVTDTTASPDADYVAQIAGVDLLVHECYFPDSKPELAALTGHSMITPVIEVAQQAGVKRLVLVHIDPASEDWVPADLAAARKIFPETELGQDLLELEF